jgi:hypothetical protein
MDMDDIRAAIEAANEAKALLEDLDLDGVKDAIEELVEPSTFLDEDVCSNLEEALAEIEAAGPNEEESAEAHAAFLEGYQAAIDRIREQYV